MPDAPYPLIEVAIVPANEIAAAQLREALPQLAAADSAFAFDHDSESGQTIIKGVSEAHLEHKLLMLKSIYEIAGRVGAPQVAYRETLTRPATIKYTYKKVTGGSGHFAEVTITFSPLPPGAGFVFENTVAAGTIPKEFIPSVERGLSAQKEAGVLAGFPVIDFKATLIDGKYHEIDSNPLTFDIAARAAFRELAKTDTVALLEPVMQIEVATPEDWLGGIIGDLNARKGTIIGTEPGITGFEIVTADVPLASLFGYGRFLLAVTGDRARFTMRFARYERVLDSNDPDRPFPGAMGMRIA
jgi:elongation factor G